MPPLTASGIHSANRKFWDANAMRWKALRDQDGLWRKCPQEPFRAFDGKALELIYHFLGETLSGRTACVVGSGDNYAAFALAGMGAEVTSVDISKNQLEVAAKRARVLGLRISFIQADAAEMVGILDAKFDLVCSTNGLFVWISSPGAVFREVYRLLKPGGYYICYELHPFLRPWKNQIAPIEMEKPYDDTGPYQEEEIGQTIYEFHWRVSDLLNALLDSSLQLRRIHESPASGAHFWTGNSYVSEPDSGLLDWKTNPRAGLPVWLTLAAQKPLV